MEHQGTLRAKRLGGFLLLGTSYGYRSYATILTGLIGIVGVAFELQTCSSPSIQLLLQQVTISLDRGLGAA